MRTIVTFMRDDHARLDSIFMEFQCLRTSDHNAAKAAFSSFKQGLHRHIVWEEAILFPIFEQRTGLVDHGPSVVMRKEHRRITACLIAIEEELKETCVHGGVEQELTQTLAAHTRKEDTVLYPWIDAIISPGEGQELLIRMRTVAEELRPDYCQRGIEGR